MERDFIGSGTGIRLEQSKPENNDLLFTIHSLLADTFPECKCLLQHESIAVFPLLFPLLTLANVRRDACFSHI